MILKFQLAEYIRQKSSKHCGLGETFTIEEANKQKIEDEQEKGRRRMKKVEEKKLSQ